MYIYGQGDQRVNIIHTFTKTEVKDSLVLYFYSRLKRLKNCIFLLLSPVQISPTLYQQRRGYAFKTGMRQVPGSVPIMFVHLAVRSFPWFSPKLAQLQVRISYKDPHGRHSFYTPRSRKWKIELKSTTTTINKSVQICQTNFSFGRDSLN